MRGTKLLQGPVSAKPCFEQLLQQWFTTAFQKYEQEALIHISFYPFCPHSTGSVLKYASKSNVIRPSILVYKISNDYFSSNTENSDQCKPNLLQWRSRSPVSMTFWIHRRDRDHNRCFQKGWLHFLGRTLPLSNSAPIHSHSGKGKEHRGFKSLRY